MTSEKQSVALTSVAAAVFLTVIKIVVGVLTGSLGVLSEAAHSAMDLCAAIVTFFAVRWADKPADSDHNYGHGKVESFSALIETLLLLLTCGWIIYEAVERLLFGKGLEVTGSYWGIGIMAISIAINISRSRALKKVAKKYGSQALEADALHFDSDIWSSYVVIGGLACVWAGDFFHLPVLSYADPLAALGVSVLVIIVSFKLGKRTIDALLDTAPKGMTELIREEVRKIRGVLDIMNIRVRPSGGHYFIDLNVGIGRHESHRVVHNIVDEIRERLQKKIPNSDIVIGTYPVDLSDVRDAEVHLAVKKIVSRFPACTNIHNIHVYDVSGRKNIAIHLEVKERMSLKESHDLSHEIGERIRDEVEQVADVSVNFEYVGQRYITAEDITESRQDLIGKIQQLVNGAPDRINCHDIRLFSQGELLTIFLHCEVCEDYPTDKVETIMKGISELIRRNIESVDSIHVHMEPAESA